MAWESVPWMVGGGALHQAEVGRLVSYIGAQGNEGVLSLNDCKVTALGTPGASVNVSAGAAAIPCRAASQLYQMYAARMLTQDTVNISATGGTARNDLVIARVEDPWLAGEPWADPPVGDEDIGPYVFTRVISGVAGSVIASAAAAQAYLISIGSSSIPLAGIALPVSTSAVTSAMITDLRSIPNPRTKRKVYTINPVAVVNLTSATTVDWLGSFSVAVPAWATTAVMTANISGVGLNRSSVSVSGTATGSVRVILGTAATQTAAYNLETSPANGVGRYGFACGDTVTIPDAMKGTTQTLKIQGLKSAGNMNIYADTGSFVLIDIEFQEVAG